MLSRRLALLATTIVLALGASVAIADSTKTQFNRSDAPESSLYAQNPMPGNGQRGSGFGQGQMMQQLNLTEQQTQQIQAIRQKYQVQMEQRRENLRTAQQQLRDLMVGNGTEAQIRTKHQEVVALRQQLGELHFESMLEMRAVLTPEQRRQFGEMMQERHQQRYENTRPGMRQGIRERFGDRRGFGQR